MRRRFVAAPSRGVGLKGIAGHNPGFEVTAARTLECPMLETFGAGRDGGRYHPRLAIGAARTVDRQELGIGSCHPRHGEKINPRRKSCLSGGRPRLKKYIRFQFTPDLSPTGTARRCDAGT